MKLCDSKCSQVVNGIVNREEKYLPDVCNKTALGFQGSLSLAVALLATTTDEGRDLSSAGLVGPAVVPGDGLFLGSSQSWGFAAPPLTTAG